MGRQRKISLLDQIVIGVLIVIIALFLSYQVYMSVAAGPLEGSRRQVIKLVKEKTDLTNVETFNLVTTDETYYSLTGTNKKGVAYAVIVPKKKGLIKEIKLSDAVSVSSLSQEKEAISIDPALYKGKAVWEVNTKSDFKLYDLKTGKLIN